MKDYYLQPSDNEKGSLSSRLEMKQWLDQYAAPYKELMAYYKCAMMVVTTRFNVLDEELSLKYDRNPIESIKSRLKTPESIMEKLQRKGLPLSIESIEENLKDVAGVRIICSFESDIYLLAEAMLMHDDIELISKKDYIKEPKKNGYRSLHMIVGVPIYLHDSTKVMQVEVQFRTIGMDWWASLEHKIMYKKDLANKEEILSGLLHCAQSSYYLDQEMQTIYNLSVDVPATGTAPLEERKEAED